MTTKPKKIIEPSIGARDKNLVLRTRMILTMSWAVLIFTLVTAFALRLVGAPIQVILLLVPVLSAGIVILFTTNRLRAKLKDAQQMIQPLEKRVHFLENAGKELELRAATQSDDLKHHAHLLEASADVIGSIYSTIFRSNIDLDQVLTESASLISECLDCPIVNIFMTETDLTQPSDTHRDMEVANGLLLRAANTETGRQLIENGYSLTLDQDNSVVTAAQTRKPILAGINHPIPPYLVMVDLPFNPSEVALPLMMDDKLLGVLNLQCSMTSPFRHEDLNALQILANQLSIAIENSLIFISNQNKIPSMEQADSFINQGAKQNLPVRQPDRGFRAGSSGDPITVSDSWHPMMIEARESGQIVFGDPVADAYTLAVPVKIRDQVAGVVRLRKTVDSGKWHPEEVALVKRLSDRLSAAIESAQLFEETRRAAEREHLTGEITARMRSTNDPQVVLQIAARELRKALHANKAQLLVQTTLANSPKVDEARTGNHPGERP
jgi:GAF domain-containing protein